MPITLNGKPFVITNTCGFDSVVHALCVSMCDSVMNKQFVDNEKDSFLLFKLVNNALRDGINVQTYKKRAIIIKSMTIEDEIVEINEVYHINAKTTIENLLQKLMKNYPSCVTTRNCENCPPKHFSSTYLIANMDDIQHLQLYIQMDENNCYMCGKMINNYLRYRSIITIDFSLLILK